MRKVMGLAMALYMVATVTGSAAQADTQQRSLEALVQAVRQNPNDLTLRREMAKAMILKGQTIAAAQQEQMMIKSGNATAEDYATLGDALRYSTNLNGAIQAYTNALRISPMNSQALGGLALAYAQGGQYGRALSIVKTGLAQAPDAQSRQFFASTLATIQNLNNQNSLAATPAANVMQ